MSRRSRNALLATALLALGGCTAGAVQPPMVSLPRGLLGSGIVDADVNAINLAAYDFSGAANTRGNPAEAARAVAAYEYIDVALRQSPRWACMPPLVLQQLDAGRLALRRQLGIAPDAPPQAVIDRMAYAFATLVHNNPAAAETALQPPVFTAGGTATLQRLQALPLLAATNIGAMNAGSVIDGSYNSGCSDSD